MVMGRWICRTCRHLTHDMGEVEIQGGGQSFSAAL